MAHDNDLQKNLLSNKITSESEYSVKWYPFSMHPESDSCWSLSTGPDGRIYAAACCEHTPGGVVKVVRYNDQTDELDYLFDMDVVTEDPHDSGRATQCKIHYSFAPSLHDNIMYMATHLSGAPFDQPAYSPWKSWFDSARCFRGAALVAFNTSTDKVEWWDTLFPKEGCRCLLNDEERGMLYALSYPRDHFFQYDIAKRRSRDLGRIGSVNAQGLFSDKKHRIWTTDDYGHLVRYDPEKDRIERSPWVLPHDALYQTGWHSVIYDLVRAPDHDAIYLTTWNGHSHIIRIWPDKGEFGEIEDLGPTTPSWDHTLPENFFIDHCGGLVFGGDGHLYYVASRWKEPAYQRYKDHEGVLYRLNTRTLQKEMVAILRRPNGASQYVSRGAVDKNGDLFFGNVGWPHPVGMFKVSVPQPRKKINAHLPLRMWG